MVQAWEKAVQKTSQNVCQDCLALSQDSEVCKESLNERNYFRVTSYKTVEFRIIIISIYTLSDLGVLSNLIGSLSLANEHYSPPTE